MSKSKKSNYSSEFKASAVKLAVESDQPVAKTARDLGINDNTLYNWIAQYSHSNKINPSDMSKNEYSFEEVKRLKKELAIVKQERDLLKKAAAYFAKTSQ